MGTRDGRLERALSLSRRLRSTAMDEVRTARIAAGLSRRQLGRGVGLSADRIGRFERGELDDVGLDLLCRLASGVGLEPGLRFFPASDPVRDAPQLRLLARFLDRIAPDLPRATEVPLVGVTDARAWDAVVTTPGCRDAVEAETRLHDIQATERRIARKARDDATIGHAILLVADTRANREALRLARTTMRGTFPLDTREALTRLAAGACPGQNALVVL